MTGKHLAAVLPRKGGPFSVQERPTPEPGPNDILIKVSAVALNPVDVMQRDVGMPPVPIYPAVIGGDAAGTLVKVGSKVHGAPSEGSRVIALASSFYQDGKPDYGAFQEYALAQSEAVIALPDHISFEEGSIMPLVFLTSLTAYTTMGLKLDTRFTPQDKEGILIWGAASCVGTYAIQTAKIMGFTVYATASAKNHEYLKGLGADALFDYKNQDVVAQIISRVKSDGVKLTRAHVVVQGALEPSLEVLRATKGDCPAQVAHSPMLFPDHATLEGTEINFNMPPRDPKERDELIRQIYQVWLKGGLASGKIVPSPKVQMEGSRLADLNNALDVLKEGVSAAKIVVKV